MKARRFIPTGCAAAFLLLGCFTPQLLDTPYQEPIESQREFSDEFNNPVHLGNRWRPVAGWWRIKNGQLFQSLPWRSSLPGEFQTVYVYGMASGPYEVETRLNFISEGEQAAGLLLRFQDQNNFYLLRMRHYPNWQDYVDLTQYISGVRREDLRRMNLSIKPGQWYTLRAEDRGNEIVAYLDGNEIFSFPTKDRPVGTVGLSTKTGRVAFQHFTASLYEPGLTTDRIEMPRTSEESPPLRPLSSRAHTVDIPNPPGEVFDPDINDW